MNNTFVETVIGAAVVVIAIVFFVFAYTAGDVGKGKGGYRLMAQFSSIDGISTGTDVRMAGVKVGTVVDQKLDFKSYEAIVTMSIEPKLKLPKDSSAKISSEGLLGGNFISLEAGGSETMLADGGRIEHTQSAFSIWDAIGKAIFGQDKK